MNLLPTDGSVKLFDHFLDQNVSDNLFFIFKKKINWNIEKINMFNKVVVCPRLISWYGDEGLNYRYSGNQHRGSGWDNFILPLKKQVESHLSTHFNFVLCNLYRDGDDYIGWHDDGEKELGPNPVIASISLGASRLFELKHKEKNVKKSLVLNAGSLLVMSGKTQKYWKHRLPKAKSCQESRINLTFRKILGDNVCGI